MGRPPKSTKTTLKCLKCEKDYAEGNFYSSDSVFFSGTGKVPYCKKCIKEFYNHYYEKYKEENFVFPEKKAIKRLCMALDIYYGEEVFTTALGEIEKTPAMSIDAAYMKVVHLKQHKDTYDKTFKYDEKDGVTESYVDLKNERDVDEKVVEFFGAGFSVDDYKFLNKEYQDWTARHECKTKAQEEVFKDICFNRLQNLKALRMGEDTKDITASFQKMLDSGKLQPKQNSGDTTADNQTFGTLIDKWENERPLPEIDEELKDVDKIGLYLNVFFKGHLAKMMGLKNGLSSLYSKFMKKYTVEKPEYDDDENSEALFDALFGSASLDSDDEQGSD